MIIKYKNKNYIYKGEFQNGLRNGKGMMLINDKILYEGF